jgi:hypothetical protein
VEEMMGQINQAQFGIADITGLNDNVLIEIGVTTANGMPLVIIREKEDNQSLSFDIAARQSYRYELKPDDILIHDATRTHRLEDFVFDFIDKMPRGDFWKAREWHGG